MKTAVKSPYPARFRRAWRFFLPKHRPPKHRNTSPSPFPPQPPFSRPPVPHELSQRPSPQKQFPSSRIKPSFKYRYGTYTNIEPESDSRYRRTENSGLTYGTVLLFPSNRYEVFSFAARSWGWALGRTGGTGGVFSSSLNVANLLVYDGLPEAHKYHSGQFRSCIQRRWGYWDQMLIDLLIPHNQP